MGQLFATCLFGVVGLTLYLIKYRINVSHQNLYQKLSISIFIILLMLFIYNYVRPSFISSRLKKILSLNHYVSKTIRTKNMLLSILRYLVFSFQFYVLLILLNVNLSYFDAMIPITSMYLLSSVIPTIVLFDFAVKGSVAFYIFEIVGVNEITIISSITLMWLLNVVVPTFIGSFFVLSLNTTKLVNLTKKVTI